MYLIHLYHRSFIRDTLFDFTKNNKLKKFFELRLTMIPIDTMHKQVANNSAPKSISHGKVQQVKSYWIVR